MPSGYSSSLPTDIVLDSGVLYVNSSTPWGVSRGGLTFDPAKEIRNIEFDGKRSPVMGLDRFVGFAPKISGTMLQVSASTDILRFEPAATSAGSAPIIITPKKAGVLLIAGDYLTTVRLVFQRGSGGYVWVEFGKALVTRYDIKGQDKAEAEVAVDIEARLDLSASTDTDVAPYLIKYNSAV